MIRSTILQYGLITKQEPLPRPPANTTFKPQAIPLFRGATGSLSGIHCVLNVSALKEYITCNWPQFLVNMLHHMDYRRACRPSFSNTYFVPERFCNTIPNIMSNAQFTNFPVKYILLHHHFQMQFHLTVLK